MDKEHQIVYGILIATLLALMVYVGHSMYQQGYERGMRDALVELY